MILLAEDDLLYLYSGTRSINQLEDGARVAGVEKMLVDLGLSRDRGQRFALWTVLNMLDAAPDLDAAFPELVDRDAARNFMDLMDRTDAGSAR